MDAHPDASEHVKDEYSQSAHDRLGRSSANPIADNAIDCSLESVKVIVWVLGEAIVDLDEEPHESVSICLHAGPAGVTHQNIGHVAAGWWCGS